MEVMLTSFGVLQENPPSPLGRSDFYHMPPASLGSVRGQGVGSVLTPDYDVLLLCERILMDGESFERITKGKERWSLWSILGNAFRVLDAEGYVKIVDFKSILHRNTRLLQKMLDHDLLTIDQWVRPLVDSLRLWVDFARGAASTLLNGDIERFWGSIQGNNRKHTSRRLFDSEDDRKLALIRSGGSPLIRDLGLVADICLMAEEALSSASKRRKREYRNALREVLSWYLAYVNANLILSNELGTGFHDWCDFSPFYQHKWLSIGKETSETTRAVGEVQKLFSVVFPEFAISDVASLMKALKDKRIASLRTLIQEAVEGKVVFDTNFAKRTLHEVLGEETKTGRWRRIVSYATIPLGLFSLVGMAAQKAADESIGKLLEKKLKKRHEWFYMLSDISGHRG